MQKISNVMDNKNLVNAVALYEETRNEYNDFNDAFCEIFQPNSVLWLCIRKLLEFYHEYMKSKEALTSKYSATEITAVLNEFEKEQ